LNTDVFVREVLDEVLSLSGRARSLPADQALRDALPDLDSMAVVSVLALIEERLDLLVEPGELTGDVFETIASLVRFVDGKLQDRA
jgi:acyl carrier protein